MMQRKGQHLFNKIAETHTLRNHKCRDSVTIPYYNLHNILFNMSDEDFDKIMSTLQNKDEVMRK